MDDLTAHMGGILDLATTQSENVFIIKNNDEASPVSQINFRNDFVNSKITENWNDGEDEFSKEDLNDTDNFYLKQNKHEKVDQPSELPLNTSGPMIWSVSSSIIETPGDSGVQCLDSETSDLTGDCPAGMTLSLVEAEELACDSTCEYQPKQKVDVDTHTAITSHIKNIKCNETNTIMTLSDIENQNTTETNSFNNNFDNVNGLGAVLVSHSSTDIPNHQSLDNEFVNEKPKNLETVKSASDDIVFRRKCGKKVGSNASQPKKRVSFHEDILNNTKTDNIHIEHGFISYRPEAAMNYFSNNCFKKLNTTLGRYSWCAVGDNVFAESQYSSSHRNTRSDVLDYGKTDVTGYLDNSGIYEYRDNIKCNLNRLCSSEMCVNKVVPCKLTKDDYQKSENNSPTNQQNLYMCSCSSSDSNLSSESDTSSQALSLTSDNQTKYSSKKCDNTQKSYSCDCIENNEMKPLMKKMYFSDADIYHTDKGEEQLQMNEILPKASCLKKSALKKKRYITTNVIEEHNTSRNNDRTVKSLLDSKKIFGSLKSIYKNINFGLSIAERGVPEGSEDCQSVSEVLPSDSYNFKESSCTKSRTNDPYSEYVKNRVDGDGVSSNSIDKLNKQSPDNRIDQKSATSQISNKQFDVSKQNLSLDMNASNCKTFLDWKSQGNLGINKNNYRDCKLLYNKFIVNCESTVYEHKGVSYCYEYDAFQTTFGTNKETFTPITDTVKSGNITNFSKENTDVYQDVPIAKNEEIVSEQNEKNDKIDTSQSDKYTNITSDIVQEKSCDENKTDSVIESDNNESGEKAKFKHSKYLAKQSESMKSGVSKHLSSPLKRRNIMRYEKFSKQLNQIDIKDCDLNFDNNSLQDTTNDSQDLEEIMDVNIEFDNTAKNICKMPLLNKFLKNVTQKKMFYSNLRNNEFFQKKLQEESLKFPNICFPSTEKISPSFRAAAKYLDSLINKEVMENKRISVKLMTADEPSYFDSFEENVAIECCEKLKLELFTDIREILHRMLKIRSYYLQENGQWSPQLVFITDRALYVADVENDKTSYCLICYLTHDLLDLIVIGPDSQYVQIFDKFGRCRCTLITGDKYLCHRLVSSLEWCARNCCIDAGLNKVYGNIPTILWKERDCLKKLLMKTSSYNKHERCLFYGVVNSCLPSVNIGHSSPFGQPMEGFLMHKTEKQRNWKPSFFMLKSGVLLFGSTCSTNLPHSIDMKNVIGVRRCTDIHGRPYCFEVAVNVGKTSLLQMAAPDDDVASQWLQGLLMHAAQALEGPKIDISTKPLPPCCTLLITSEHIITLRENLNMENLILNIDRGRGVDYKNVNNIEPQLLMNNSIEILSFASIKDLTALKIPDSDDNWCILEFIFCEIHEGTEMGLLFASSAELERFIAVVESVWHKTNGGVFPISVQPSSDAVSKRCSEWHNHFITAWDKLLPTAHR